jgi:hypothetical protein
MLEMGLMGALTFAPMVYVSNYLMKALDMLAIHDFKIFNNFHPNKALKPKNHYTDYITHFVQNYLKNHFQMKEQAKDYIKY